MKRKTLEFKTGTLSPCGEIISGRLTLMLSIADMSVSKICTDKLNPRLMKVNQGFLF